MFTRDDMIVQTEPGKDAPIAFRPAIPNNAVHWIPPVPNQQTKAPSYLVYQDGVFVSGRGEIGQKVGDDPFPAHAWLNYSTSARSELTASRSAFRRDPKDSPEWVVIRARTFAFQKEIQRARALAPVERLRKLAHIEKFFSVGNNSVVEAIPWNEYPVIVLDNDGKINCVPASEAHRPGFFLVPRTMRKFANPSRAFNILDGEEVPAAADYPGGIWIIELPTHYNGDSLLRQSVSMLQYVFIEHALFPIALTFLASSDPSEGPTPERVFLPRLFRKPESVRPLLERMRSDPLSLNAEEWGRVRVAANVDGGHIVARKTFGFPAPFNKYFALGLEYFNLDHSATQWLVRFATILYLQGGVSPPRRSDITPVHNWFQHLFQQKNATYGFFAQWWQTAQRLIEATPGRLIQTPPACPSIDEFFPTSMPNS